MKKSLSFFGAITIALAVFIIPVSLFAQEGSITDENSTSTIEGDETTSPELDPGVDETTIILNAEADSEGSLDTADGENGNQFSTLGIFDYLRMVLVLGIIIVVIYFFFYILKKFSNRNLVSNDLISIMGTQVIKGDTALHIVELGNNYYLVGSGSGNVSLIDKITDKETLDQIKLTLERRNAEPKANFKDILFSKINIPLVKPSVNDSVDSSLRTIQSQRDSLNRFDPENIDGTTDKDSNQ